MTSARFAAAVALGAALLLTSACAEVETYGRAAAGYRRQMNDLQAIGTIDALCDLSVGSVFRRPPEQRDLVLMACGGQALLQRSIMVLRSPEDPITAAPSPLFPEGAS